MCICVYERVLVSDEYVYGTTKYRSNSSCTIKEKSINAIDYYVRLFVICKGLSAYWNGMILLMGKKHIKHALIAESISMNTFDRMIHHKTLFYHFKIVKLSNIFWNSIELFGVN